MSFKNAHTSSLHRSHFFSAKHAGNYRKCCNSQWATENESQLFFVNESVWHDSVITTSWVAEWIFAYERKSAKLKRYFATSQELSSALILVQISKYWCSCVFYRSSRKKYFVFLCKYWQRKTWWWHRKFTSSQQEHKEGRIVKTKQKQQKQLN